MNCLGQFTHFLESATDDPRIGSSHISLYVTLYQYWIYNQCVDPVYIRRCEVMKTAKISGIATYHKCIKELDDYGYIRYAPSYCPKRSTEVFMSFKG
jgi:hypothetical protein